MPAVTILHTNDFHNHLTEAQSQRLGAMRRDLGASGLLLDAGDAVSSGNVTYRPGGEPILDIMSEAGYDAMTVGNREFHFSQAGFAAKVGRARFPVLSANVRARGGAKLPVEPSITRELGGVRVTVFGVTVPMITERMLSCKVSAYVFDDPVATAASLAPALRPECDLLVCLSHAGLARDREIAATVPEIDLVVGGHTHATLEHGERPCDGGALVVQAGWWGRLLGIVTVEFGAEGPELSARVEPL